MQLLDQRHVAEDVGVAHVIDAFPVVEVNDDAVRHAEIGDLAAFLDARGGMERLREGDGEAVELDGATGVGRLDGLDTLGRQPVDQFIGSEDSGARTLGDVDRVADVVAMTVRQQDVCGASLAFATSPLKCGFPVRNGSIR